MSRTTKKSWLFAGAAMFLAACPLFAAPPPTVTFNLTGVGTTKANLGGVFTSPYQGNINGGSTIPVICDDFASDSYVPESWTAYVTQASSLTATTADSYLHWVDGNSLTVDGFTLTQAEAYAVASVLAVDILQSAGATTPAGTNAQQDYSFALWGLFDASAFNALSGHANDLIWAAQYLLGAVTEVKSSSSTDQAQVQADVNAVTIYSYAYGAAGSGCPGATCPQPQEFLTVSMAEPPSPAMLGFDLLAVGGLIFLSRRRLTRPVL